jgi:hypothetical protein
VSQIATGRICELVSEDMTQELYVKETCTHDILCKLAALKVPRNNVLSIGRE